MKTSALYILLFFLSALTKVNAQQNELVPDQNPRYKESQQRYIKAADSLTNTQGITVQQTYKAYDWYEARLERRQQRREWRHQENLNGGYYNNSYWSGYYNPYSWGNSSLWLIPSINFHWGHGYRRWH